MSKSLSNVLKGNNNTVLPAAGNTGNVLTSTGNTWVSSAPAASGASATKTISNKTGAYTVVAGDLGTIINCTSGTFTVSLTAAATLGSGFTCTIWNTATPATNVITIDPAGSETIDGRSTLTLQRGEGLDIVCNGTDWEISNKKPMRAYAENESLSNSRPIASGSASLAIGVGAVSSASGAMAFGGTASASGTNALSLGYTASANSINSTAIGANSGGTGSQAVTGAGAMALNGSYASGTDSFAAAVSNNTSSYGAIGDNSIAIGRLAKASAANSVAIGSGSSGVGAVANTGAGAIALGASYASGVDSFAAAIKDNTSTYGATGANSIAIGQNAKASATGAFAFGYYSSATTMFSMAIGPNAVASAGGAVALCGLYNGSLGATAAGLLSFALGEGAKSSQTGKYSFSCGSFSALGDAQFGNIVLRAATTTTTAVVLTTDVAVASTANQLIVASGQAMAIQGTLIAKVTASGAMAGWNITGIVSNNAGTMAVSGLALTAIGTDSITLGAQPTIAVDNTNKGITITSGYKSATNIRWVATLNTSEVTYA